MTTTEWRLAKLGRAAMIVVNVLVALALILTAFPTAWIGAKLRLVQVR